MSFESHPYGGPTTPGGLFRDTNGNHFNYESDKKGVLVGWSTERSAQELLEAFEQLSNARPLKRGAVIGMPRRATVPDESMLDTTFDEKTGERVHEATISPQGVDILDIPTQEAIGIIRSGATPIVVARLAFSGVDLMWHQPYQRFIDRDTMSAEASLYTRTRDFDSLLVRSLARATGNAAFFDENDVYAKVYKKGAFAEVGI